MYVKSTRPSAKREVQKERSAKRDDRIARPRRAQTCERDENMPAKRPGFFDCEYRALSVSFVMRMHWEKIGYWINTISAKSMNLMN